MSGKIDMTMLIPRKFEFPHQEVSIQFAALQSHCIRPTPHTILQHPERKGAPHLAATLAAEQWLDRLAGETFSPMILSLSFMIS